jgi:hypothetical protein
VEKTKFQFLSFLSSACICVHLRLNFSSFPLRYFAALR